MNDQYRIIASVSCDRSYVKCSMTGTDFVNCYLSFHLQDGRPVSPAYALNAGFTMSKDHYELIDGLLDDWFDRAERQEKKAERKIKRRKKLISEVLDRLAMHEDESSEENKEFFRPKHQVNNHHGG